MNLVTSGIILYSFYICVCMDPDGGDGGNNPPGDNPPPSRPAKCDLMPTDDESNVDLGTPVCTEGVCSPHGHAADGTLLAPVDAKDVSRNAHASFIECTGPDNKPHHVFTPGNGCGFCSVSYNGGPVWDMEGENYGTKVDVHPIGSSHKTIEVTLKDGTTKKYKKNGKGKPWEEKN
uniref:Secreted protein n=1 Tax=Theileria annulata TaxID=5874 RepID=A0A3B0MMT2_THEAN